MKLKKLNCTPHSLTFVPLATFDMAGSFPSTRETLPGSQATERTKDNDMIKTVKVDDLKIGMYVTLGDLAEEYSFLDRDFMISTKAQIVNIMDKGIEKVKIDTEKSDILDFGDGQKMTGAAETHDLDPLEDLAEELRETLADASAPPKTKARAVYDHSIQMMHSILEKPSPGNILKGKKMITGIVDHILADDETADYLTKITSHDYYTYTHSVNVGLISVLLAKAIYKDSEDHDMAELGAGFFLHDLGKCDVPAYLINKPGKLSDSEWVIMRKHPTYGQRVLAEADQLTPECGVIVMQHHEREDGSGYPFGRKGHHIHDYARICTLADVYDALTSTRAYRKPVSPDEALRIMKEQMYHFFNKDLFAEFVQLFSK